MKVKDVMETDLVSVLPETRYEEVAKIIYSHNISGVPVVDMDGGLLGFISEKDIFRVLYPWYKSYYEHPEYYTDMEGRESKVLDVKEMKAEMLMVKNPIATSPNEPIMKVGALMMAHRISRMPVVENGRVIGMVSRKIIYRAILKKNFGL